MTLQRLRMVRGVSENHVSMAGIHQRTRQVALPGGNLVAPVPAPVDRHDQHVAGPANLGKPRCKLVDNRGCRLGQQSDPRALRRRGPMRRNAAVAGRAGDDKHPLPFAGGKNAGGPGLGGGSPRAGNRDTLGAKRLDGLDQPGHAPVHDVVVGEDAGIEPCRCQHADIARMHTVVDPLRRRLVGTGYGGLQVHDPQIGGQRLEIGQQVAPDIAGRDVARDGSRGILGQPHVISGIGDPVFEQPGIRRCGQDLVYAATGHDVAAEEQANRPSPGHVRMAGTTSRNRSAACTIGCSPAPGLVSAQAVYGVVRRPGAAAWTPSCASKRVLS